LKQYEWRCHGEKEAQSMLKQIKRMLLWLRRLLKNAIYILLAPCYYICCLRPVRKGLVVLADGHIDRLPYSMQALRERLTEIDDITVVEYFHDYSFCNMIKGFWIMLRFMPLYARAEYVFLCDCFIPTTCCKKRKGTTVVQLWHSCGLMKKVGVDSPEDAMSMKKTQYRNTDVFTTSADVVSDVLSKALLIPRENFSTAGVNRMDLLYRKDRCASLKKYFYENYPEYRGKKLVLWAPSFRGNVHDSHFDGEEVLLKLQKELGEDYAIILKTHRFAGRTGIDTPVRITAEQLLTIADCLITDYSSIYFDYLYFRKPVILFAPDLQEYEEKRGIYPKYTDTPGYFAENEVQLRKGILTMDTWANEAYRAQQDKLWDEQMTFCDGKSTDKLLKELGILKNDEVSA